MRQQRVDVVIYRVPKFLHRDGSVGKVGCAQIKFFRERVYEYKRKGYQWQIIDSARNVTLLQAGNLEWSWADYFGYPRGKHYKNAPHGAWVRKYRPHTVDTEP